MRWGLPPEFMPLANELNPPQPDDHLHENEIPLYAEYYDALLAESRVRLKLFYDPEETMNDIYVNRGELPWGIPTVSLGNTVWLDNNGNGLYEPGSGEPGIEDVLVEL